MSMGVEFVLSGCSVKVLDQLLSLLIDARTKGQHSSKDMPISGPNYYETTMLKVYADGAIFCSHPKWRPPWHVERVS